MAVRRSTIDSTHKQTAAGRSNPKRDITAISPTHGGEFLASLVPFLTHLRQSPLPRSYPCCLAFTLSACAVRCSACVRFALLPLSSARRAVAALNKMKDTLGPANLFVGWVGDPCTGMWLGPVTPVSPPPSPLSPLLTSPPPPLSASLPLSPSLSLSLLHSPSLSLSSPPSPALISNFESLNVDGTLADDVSRLTSLQILYVPFPPLTDLTASWASNLASNQFTGKLPKAISTLTNLQHLDVSNNKFEGKLPDAFSQLTALRHLDASQNSFVSELPASLNALSSVTYINLAKNQISGSLPDSLTGLSELTYLSVADNSMSGTLPASLGSLAKLSKLDLSNNAFTGPVPSTYSAIPNLITTGTSLDGAAAGAPASAGAPTGVGWAEGADGAGQCACVYPLLFTLRLGMEYSQFTPDKQLVSSPALAPRVRVLRRLKTRLGMEYSQFTPDKQLSLEQQLESGFPVQAGQVRKQSTRAGSVVADMAVGPVAPATMLDQPTVDRSLEQQLEAGFSVQPGQVRTQSTRAGSVVADLAVGPVAPETKLDQPTVDRVTGILYGTNGSISLSGFGSVTVVQLVPPNQIARNDTGAPPPSPPAPAPAPASSSSGGWSTAAIIGVAVAGFVVAVLLVVALVVLCMRCRPSRKDAFQDDLADDAARPAFQSWANGSSAKANGGASSRKSQGVPPVSLAELQMATDDFAPDRRLGTDPLGTTFVGTMPDGTEVAVKKIEPSVVEGQSDEDFVAVAANMARLRHGHVVQLQGYCVDYAERILVFQHCAGGSLYDHLHRNDDDSSQLLSWDDRVDIALDAAEALVYLHEECMPPMVHRSISSRNVLLDSSLRARVAGAGLSFLNPVGTDEKSLSDQLVGGFAYNAPEYAMSGIYTAKSDVYSFGVVLLELLTGRKPVDSSKPKAESSLVRWAAPLLHDVTELEAMLDQHISGPLPDVSKLTKFAEVITRCIQPEPDRQIIFGKRVLPRPAATTPVDQFSEERAMAHVTKLAGDIGDRQEGTEGLAEGARYILGEVERLRSIASPRLRVEVEESSVSGSFSMVFLQRSLSLAYQNLTNVVVRISNAATDPDEVPSVLMNAHFDSALGSPGAGDCATCVAAMLEVLRLYVEGDRMPTVPLIFLFNGGEEVFMKASHGFITRHHWSETVGAMVNFEAAGTALPEMVVQSGPVFWPQRVYGETAVYPSSSVVCLDIFPHIPGDDDYRMFSHDFDDVPSLDSIYLLGGTFYHTSRDSPENVMLGALQLRGENLLPLLEGLSRAPELKTRAQRRMDAWSEPHTSGSAVVGGGGAGNSTGASMPKDIPIFFDLFNMRMVMYPRAVAAALNVIFLAALYLVPSHATEAHLRGLQRQLAAVSHRAHARGCSACHCVLPPHVLVRARMDETVFELEARQLKSRPMSWYAQPVYAQFMLIPAAVLGLLLPHYIRAGGTLSNPASLNPQQEVAFVWSSHWACLSFNVGLSALVMHGFGGSGTFINWWWAFFMLPALFLYTSLQATLGKSNPLALLGYLLPGAFPAAFSTTFAVFFLQFMSEKMGATGTPPLPFGGKAVSAETTVATGDSNDATFLLHHVPRLAGSLGVPPPSHHHSNRTALVIARPSNLLALYPVSSLLDRPLTFPAPLSPRFEDPDFQLPSLHLLRQHTSQLPSLRQQLGVDGEWRGGRSLEEMDEREIENYGMELDGEGEGEGAVQRKGGKRRRIHLELSAGSLSHVWSAVLNITGPVTAWSLTPTLPAREKVAGGPPSLMVHYSGAFPWQLWIEVKGRRRIHVDLAVLDHEMDADVAQMKSLLPDWTGPIVSSSYVAHYTF
ncbi:unnamed protein product [Closterium sp. Naga37s-1]|nr:unnamed protein product [Closterium sp. Naga37s-1]